MPRDGETTGRIEPVVSNAWHRFLHGEIAPRIHDSDAANAANLVERNMPPPIDTRRTRERMEAYFRDISNVSMQAGRETADRYMWVQPPSPVITRTQPTAFTVNGQKILLALRVFEEGQSLGLQVFTERMTTPVNAIKIISRRRGPGDIGIFFRCGLNRITHGFKIVTHGSAKRIREVNNARTR